jgi:hypothetical protein
LIVGQGKKNYFQEDRIRQKINEKEFAKSLGVSRTPIRETWLRLEHEGIVKIIILGSQFGFRITHMNMDDRCTGPPTLDTGLSDLLGGHGDMGRNIFGVSATRNRSGNNPLLHLCVSFSGV